ncbi:MAG: RNA methyltransferase [Muribaculaceae bacterium]|nr:RNA methyltransferase [Muribaculaceae bacterium]
MSEITNALRKLVRSLGEAKSRRENHLFVAEGTKCVRDTAGHFSCRYIFAKSTWLEANADVVKSLCPAELFPASTADLERMTQLSTAPQVIAVYEIPPQLQVNDIDNITHELVVALDRIQDPGNLGTIIRLCDWMGVTSILASQETVDVWSPKVVQSTMGAIARVNIIYCDLVGILKNWPSPVYGTYLHAPSIYTADLGASGVVVFGNEGQGISDAVGQCVTQRLLIPSFPPNRPTSESLNVATAAAITLSQFRSRQLRSRN